MKKSFLRGATTPFSSPIATSNTGRVRFPQLLLLFTCLAPGLALACGCGCGVFDIGTGSMFPAHSGGMLFAEYDFLDQSRNWSGSSRAPAGDNGDKSIRTSFVTFGGQYMFNRSWGATLEIPYWDRYFKTTDEDTGEVVAFTHGALGDIRIKGIYTGFSADMSTGVTFGLKLPTGDFSYENFDPDTEIGSGSTDALIGAYHLGTIGETGKWDWFVEAQWQEPIAHKTGYRPGAELDAVAGIHYSGWSFGRSGNVAPVLQVKGVYRESDGGALAEPENTGNKRVVLAPGVQAALGKVSVFLDLGIPLYTSATGNQLVAPLLWKLNLGYHF